MIFSTGCGRNGCSICLLSRKNRKTEKCEEICMSHWIWLPGEIKTESFNFDSIYAAYLSFETDGDVKIGAMWYEKPDQTNENDTYSLTFSGDKEISLSPVVLTGLVVSYSHAFSSAGRISLATPAFRILQSDCHLSARRFRLSGNARLSCLSRSAHIL